MARYDPASMNLDSDPPVKARAFLNFIYCLQTCVKKNRPFPVAISEKLPHIIFPLGRYGPGLSWKHSSHISAIYDSAAGVSLGLLEFFEDLARKFPELVHKFAPIDPAFYSKVLVGNIDRHCEASACTHYIQLYTPFIDEGLPVTWQIALSPDLSVNLLMGIPFIFKAKMVANFAEGFVSSSVFQATFKLEFKTPVLQDSVPQQDGHTPLFATPVQDGTHTITRILDPNNPKATGQ